MPISGSQQKAREAVRRMREETKKAFTPGPWKADTNLGCKRISTKVGAQHRQAKRTELAFTSGLWDEEEDRANARLIAKAPDLYELVVESLYHLRLDDRAKDYHRRVETLLKEIAA